MWKKFGLGNKWDWKDLTKLPDKNKMLILLLIGILLVVIALPTSREKERTDDGGVDDASFSGSPTGYETYEANLERKLERALEQVEGVGKVSVMITLRSTGEKVVEKDAQSDSQTVEESDSTGGNRKTQNKTLDQTSIYEQSSDGTQSPYISKEMTPEVEGIVIIAQGGDNPVTIQNITEAAQALFGVEAHKIKIRKREDS